MSDQPQTRWLDFSGIPLLQWRRDESNWPDDKMLYKGATEGQVCFVGDTLPRAYCNTREDYKFAQEGMGVRVIGGHTSKSCYLPVYGLDIPHLGVRSVMSNNFYRWVVSIDLPRPVDLSMFDDRMSTEACNPLYCSGFDARWVLGPKSHYPMAFTVEMGSREDIYAMFLFINHALRTPAPPTEK